MLERLEAANLFLLAMDEERHWYRYHQLFADLLRRRVAQRVGPAGVTQLHVRASRWYEQSELTVEAVSHALASGDAERLAHLIEHNALATFFQGHRATAVKWLEAVPNELMRSRPWLSLAYAWVMASSGQWNMVESLLSSAESASRLWDLDRSASRPDAAPSPRSRDPEARRMAGHFLVLQAYMTGIKGDMDTARELARSALQCVPAEDQAIRSLAANLVGSTLRLSGDLAGASKVWTEALTESRLAGDTQSVVVVLGSLASLAIEQAQLRRAEAISREILDFCREQIGRGASLHPLLGTTYSRLGMIHLEWNDLPTALSHAEEGLRLSRPWGHLEALTTGQVVLAWALLAAGDVEGALSAVGKAGELSSRLSPWYRAIVEGEQARIWLAQGNLQAAARWARDSGLTQDEIRFDRMREYLILARVLVAQGRGEEALLLLSRLLEVTEAAGALKSVVEALVVRALALQVQRDTEGALSALERALAITEPEGHVRTFIDEGEPMKGLLRHAAAHGIAPAYVTRLLEAYGVRAPGRQLDAQQALPTSTQAGRPGVECGAVSRPSPLVESLSERELEVLRLLDTSLTVPEIADRLVVSASTVRSHVKSIYGKLDAHHRMQALEIARELEIL
jgi:LuxR family maltose regulon positive regulatory protein